MNNAEFIDQIRSYYEEARHLTCDNCDNQIIRGKNHSISGKSEDLFALWLSKNLNNKDLKYFVDKPISSHLKNFQTNRRKSIQPDVFILEGAEIKGYLDVKMDLGWQRDLSSYLIYKNNLINVIKGQNLVRFSSCLKYQAVVLSAENGSKKKSDKNTEIVQGLENVELYILSGEQHLNMYKKHQKKRKLFIYDNEFERLLNDINDIIKK